MNEPIITLIGNLTSDPELRYTKAGKPVCDFTVASTPRVKNFQGDYVDGTPLFIKCSVWDKQGEHCADSLTKGARVIVYGRLERQEYEDKQGNKRDSLKLTVDEVGLALRFKTARVGDASPRSEWEQPPAQDKAYAPPF